MTRAYEAATRQTGQSDPKTQRSAPNHSSTRWTYGVMSRTVQRFQSASVTIPESLMNTLGNAASGFRPAAHSLVAPDAIGGFAMWSITNRISGIALTIASAAGSSRVFTRMSYARPDLPSADMPRRTSILLSQ